MAKKKKKSTSSDMDSELTEADFISMMSRLESHESPRHRPYLPDWQALTAEYEADTATEHKALTARMRDDLLRRREDLRLEELAASRADPRLNYAERMHEAYMRGDRPTSSEYDLPFPGDRYRGEGYARHTGSQRVPGVPEVSGWPNMDQKRAELYGPLADTYSVPWSERPLPPAPGRYTEQELSYLVPLYDYDPSLPYPEKRSQPMEFPEYMGPSPYPREATQRERFMDMLEYYMEGTGEEFPVPKESKVHKKYWDEVLEQKGGQKRGKKK